MPENKLNIAMLGHKHMLSREGGIEIVVYNLATRLAEKGHKVVVYDRNTSNVADMRNMFNGCSSLIIFA